MTIADGAKPVNNDTIMRRTRLRSPMVARWPLGPALVPVQPSSLFTTTRNISFLLVLWALICTVASPKTRNPAI